MTPRTQAKRLYHDWNSQVIKRLPCQYWKLISDKLCLIDSSMSAFFEARRRRVGRMSCGAFVWRTEQASVPHAVDLQTSAARRLTDCQEWREKWPDGARSEGERGEPPRWRGRGAPGRRGEDWLVACSLVWQDSPQCQLNLRHCVKLSFLDIS